jgi:phosphatidylinositol alpha-1,6-mannosyltransferase
MPTLILLTNEFPPGPGGIGNHAYHLARQLVRLGWEVRVIAPQDFVSEAEIQDFNRQQPFQIIRASSGQGSLHGGVARFSLLDGQLRKKEVDLLVATSRSAVMLGSLAARLFGVKLVAVGHGTEFNAPDRWSREILRQAYQQANAVICVSYYTWGLMEKMGIRPRAGQVITNGADDTRFHILSPEAKQDFRQKAVLPDGPILLTVGRVNDRKGQEIVIRALPEILQEFPETHYLMAGLPEKKQELTEMARQLGVAEHIHFLGRVSDEDLVGYLNCCDLFLMPSRVAPDGDCEGFGIAVVEAALCGKPSIVSMNSGLPEAIVDGTTGLAIPDNDVDATARAVLQLLQNRPLLQKMGEAAHSIARERQTWEVKAAEYDHTLRDLLAVKGLKRVPIDSR